MGLEGGFRFRYPHLLLGGQRLGLTFSMVSHDLAVVTHLCDDILVIPRDQTVERVLAADLADRSLANPTFNSLSWTQSVPLPQVNRPHRNIDLLLYQ